MNAAKLHETALHHAAKTRSIDLIDLLVEFGGNVYARDNLNKKPIHYTSLGSSSYLCLKFYEGRFFYICIKCASGCGCCQYIHHLGAQIKCHLCSVFLRYPPQSTAVQQTGTQEGSWRKITWSFFQAGFAQPHHMFSFLHATSSYWNLITYDEIRPVRFAGSAVLFPESHMTGCRSLQKCSIDVMSS